MILQPDGVCTSSVEHRSTASSIKACLPRCLNLDPPCQSISYNSDTNVCEVSSSPDTVPCNDGTRKTYINPKYTAAPTTPIAATAIPIAATTIPIATTETPIATTATSITSPSPTTLAPAAGPTTTIPTSSYQSLSIRMYFMNTISQIFYLPTHCASILYYTIQYNISPASISGTQFDTTQRLFLGLPHHVSFTEFY